MSCFVSEHRARRPARAVSATADNPARRAVRFERRCPVQRTGARPHGRAVASALYSDSDGFRFAESRADRPSMGIRRGSGPTPEVRGQAVLMARWASQRAPPAVAVSVPQRPGGRRAQGRRICRGRRPGVRGNMLLQNVARRTDTCHRASDAASSMPCASSRSSSPVFCPCRAGRGDGVREASAREVPPPCSSRPGPEMPWYAGHRR